MPPLPQGKAEHQQGSLSACSDHWDGAAAQAGTSGSPIGVAAKNSLILTSLSVVHLLRLLTGHQPTCIQLPPSSAQYFA